MRVLYTFFATSEIVCEHQLVCIVVTSFVEIYFLIHTIVYILLTYPHPLCSILVLAGTASGSIYMSTLQLFAEFTPDSTPGSFLYDYSWEMANFRVLFDTETPNTVFKVGEAPYAIRLAPTLEFPTSTSIGFLQVLFVVMFQCFPCFSWAYCKMSHWQIKSQSANPDDVKSFFIIIFCVCCVCR